LTVGPYRPPCSPPVQSLETSVAVKADRCPRQRTCRRRTNGPPRTRFTHDHARPIRLGFHRGTPRSRSRGMSPSCDSSARNCPRGGHFARASLCGVASRWLASSDAPAPCTSRGGSSTRRWTPRSPREPCGRQGDSGDLYHRPTRRGRATQTARVNPTPPQPTLLPQRITPRIEPAAFAVYTSGPRPRRARPRGWTTGTTQEEPRCSHDSYGRPW
jgi:hypothetical protein